MSARLLMPPAVEPVSLTEAKVFLRIAHADDDGLITPLIAAARAHVERRTRRALITQTWRIVCDAWPKDGVIRVVPAPVQALAAARLRDADGTAQALDLDGFVVDASGAPARLAFVPWAVPQPRRTHAGIELDVVAGYGDEGSAVPEPLRLAVRLLLAHWYEHRGTAGALPPVPAAVTALMAPYRVLMP